ncbi:hypothetical protein B9T10_07860 [Wohlfahrtiimonas chitiniclastica]|uniref:AAA family ATPase n=1 Tax=Wohlfahrtiimonas chitiniclastica TaxID=400946 RepID=UPI000B9973A2|nr:AAA family ATPase [Wohlfahrtiimonas chitiniclastica]MDC7252068.1 hypothetical protein [Wohlfahrtiimonas chitiniclastica]OYQ87967.1 hypothetical protein B9T10_07860 [Wohlfahrtiimonas chitiniclastica]
MKLIRAKINNFRLLKDIILDFSTNSNKPLTVIRAANESGKTTCEYALMWGLWGEEALPSKKYSDFIVFPADITAQNPKEITTVVEIEFYGPSLENQLTAHYRLIRSLTQRREERPFENITIFEITANGAKDLSASNAKLLINSLLPLSLKDIYFTDGDRALSFIESGTQDYIKRRRVSDAIKSLLALEELESSIRHLDNVEKKFESEIDDKDYAAELIALNKKMEFQQETIDDLQKELQELEPEKHNLSDNKRQANERIEEILKQGDKQALIREKNSHEQDLTRLEASQKQILKSLRDLVQDKDVSSIFLSEQFSIAKNFLNSLKDKKQLPKLSIPILEELLTKNICFCGSSLSPNTTEGQQNIQHIQSTIKDSADADHKIALATELHFDAKNYEPFESKKKWMTHYEQQMSAYLNFDRMLRDKHQKLKDIQESINNIQDDALEGYRIKLKKYDQELGNVLAKIHRKQAQMEEANIKLKELNEDKEKISKKHNINDKGVQKAYLAKALKVGFKKILNKLKTDEIHKVSNEMNRIFIEMIGSAPDANDFASITKAELSANYDILVYGNSGKLLNPDQDLNGASRRAITLAFILALTKVSEVEAPNVIDTPLGMMSGYVKQSVLNQMIREGNQIILFLTHDEINGVERIIDQYADCTYTLTNPAHYPRMLKHKPNTVDARILRCDCGHKDYCDTCERNEYQEGVR